MNPESTPPDQSPEGTPDRPDLDGPGTGDLVSEPAASSAAATGSSLVQKGVEAGVKKATGSDVAVSAVRGAQKARNGDLVGGVQDVAASGAGALAAGALASTGVAAPMAGAAGSAVTSIFQTKAFRLLIVAMAAACVGVFVLQAVVVTGITAAVLTAVVPSSGQVALSEACLPSAAADAGGAGGPDSVRGNSIEEKVWNYLVDAGYSPEQTAGVMGNIYRESKFNPFLAEGLTAEPNTSRGWGLVQWTADRHVAVRDAVTKELGDRFYVAAPDYETLPAGFTEAEIDSLILFQMRYIITELQTNEKAAGDALKATTTVEEATLVFEDRYERSGVEALDERVGAAQGYYEQFAGAAPAADSATPASTTAPVAESGGGAIIPPVEGLSAVGMENARLIIATTRAEGWPDEAAILAITTAYGESTLGENTTAMTTANGDGDQGLYQMRVIPGDGAYYGTPEQVQDVEWSTRAWLNGVTTHMGTMYSLSSYPGGGKDTWQSQDPVTVIHKIQGNTAETNFVYENNRQKAQNIFNAVEGSAPASSSSSAGSATGGTVGGGECAPAASTGIPGTVQPGQVAACPNGNPACVNIAALTQPSANMACPAGTSDAGVADGYYEGQRIPIRLCKLEGATMRNGGPILMNAMIAPQFLNFYRQMAEAGHPVTISSTFRTMQRQIELQGPNAASPGWSNHQFGMAFDIGSIGKGYSRNNCSGHTAERACIPPGGGSDAWNTLREVGLANGMYIHDQEFWHIEFLPSGLNRNRGIDYYKG